MDRRWHGRDIELEVRMLAVSVALLALYVALGRLLWWGAGPDFWPIMFVAVGVLAVQYFGSGRLALSAMGARVVGPEEAHRLQTMVERLAAAAGVPKPKIAISNSPVPNALTVGRNPQNAVVVVTTGLLGCLHDDELEAVLAHEISHIKSYDVAVMTVTSFFYTLTMIIAIGIRHTLRRNPFLLLCYPIVLFTQYLLLVYLSELSRYRELAADRGSVTLTGSPGSLIAALTRINNSVSSEHEPIATEDLRRMEIVSPLLLISTRKMRGLIASLFDTHPPLAARLERLQRLMQEMEKV